MLPLKNMKSISKKTKKRNNPRRRKKKVRI